MSTESDQIAELASAVSAMQEQTRKSSAAAGLPVLTMADMTTAREMHRRMAEARQPRPVAAPFAGSIVPPAFIFNLATPDAALEAEVRRDLDYQLESAHYTAAREQWWAALSGGDRRAIDRAGMELMARYAAATGAVYGVAIRNFKVELARQKREIAFLETQNHRLEQETRDHKQRADAMEIAHMTGPPAIPAPDVHVTLALPDEIGVRLAPNPGVMLDFDENGQVIGTRPREAGR